MATRCDLAAWAAPVESARAPERATLRAAEENMKSDARD